jgi:hypothetical protein
MIVIPINTIKLISIGKKKLNAIISKPPINQSELADL